MRPKVEGTLRVLGDRAEVVKQRIAARLKQHKANAGSKVTGNVGEQQVPGKRLAFAAGAAAAPQEKRDLHVAGAFSDTKDRDEFWSWLVTEAGNEIASGHLTSHDCGEDEPEPVHLPYEHIDYQTWRATRNCRARNFQEIWTGESEDLV
jgi:hypothetical protein